MIYSGCMHDELSLLKTHILSFIRKRNMVFSPLILRSKTFDFKTPSISLPSQSHPPIPLYNEQCEDEIWKSLNGLKDLYNGVDDHFLLLAHTQKQYHRKWANEALDTYLGLLDVCAATKDVLSYLSQDLQQLLSILRRRRDLNDFGGYLSSGNKAMKVAHKSIKDMKAIKNKQTLLAAIDRDQETVDIVGVSNEAEAVTLAVLEALLSYVVGTARPRNRSIVFKQAHKKRLACHGINEFRKVKDEISSFIALKNVKNQLGKMDASMRNFEEGLDWMFRRLLKIRVSLLNMLNN